MNGDRAISIPGGGDKGRRKRKERAPKSDVWNHFDKMDSETRTKIVRRRQVDVVTVKCKYCGKKFEHTNSDGTSRLWNHYKRACPNLKLKAATTERPDAGCSLPNHNVDDTSKHDILLAKAILRHDILLPKAKRRLGDGYDMRYDSFFQIYVQSLCPGYELPSQYILVCLFNEIYGDELDKLRQVFEGLSSRVSFAFSDQGPYTYATAFFIDNSWNWKKKIIEQIWSIDYEWEPLESHRLLYTITVNDKSIRLLDLPSEASSLDDEASISENHYSKSLDDQLYEALSSKSCYFRIKCAIQVINEAAEKGISFYTDLLKKLFPNDKRDIFSWKQAFMRLCHTLSWNNASADILNEKERNLAGVLQHCWSCFDTARQSLNIDQCAGSGDFFIEFCKMQSFLRKSSDHMDEEIRVMVQQMKSVIDEYWKSHKTLLSIMCFLDPRYRKKEVERNYSEIFQTDGERELKEFTAVIKKIMEFYAHVEGENDSSSLHSSIKDELDSYTRQEIEFEEEIAYHPDIYGYFQVLQWWKQNNGKFKILGRMAKDILGIPLISTAKARTVNDCIDNFTIVKADWGEELLFDNNDFPRINALCLRDWLGDEDEEWRNTESDSDG